MKKSYSYIIIAGVLSGGITSGAAFLVNQGLSLYQLSTFPFFITLILMGPYIILKKDFLFNKEKLYYYATFGLVAALTTLMEFTPIMLGVSVAVTVLLIYTQPIWNVIISKLFLKEEITKSKIVALIISLIGIVVLINPFAEKIIGNVWGIGAGIISGACLAVWVIMGKISANKNYSPSTSQFYQAFFCFLFLLLFYPIITLVIKDPNFMDLSIKLPLHIWVYIALYELFFFIIAHLLLFEGEKTISASTAGIILLLEPLTAAILASIFLGQRITTNILIGGILILGANYLLIKNENEKEQKTQIKMKKKH